MATFMGTETLPTDGEAWEYEGELWQEVERHFSRANRLVFLMENEDGLSEYFVFAV